MNDGEISSVLPTPLGSGANASFGAVSGVVVDVTHGDSVPVAAVVQPSGSAGAVTPSNVSPHTVIRHVIVSILTPTAATLLSDAILHFSRTLWPFAAAGSVTVDVT